MTEHHQKFSLIYKLIKDSADIPFKPEQFIERAKVFSVPIFNRLLLLFTVLKFCNMLVYFIFWEKTFINTTIICGFLLIIQCLIIMFFKFLQSFKIFLVFRLADDYVTLRILRVIFIVLFFFEENLTIYTYKEFTFQVNPGFIFVLNLSVFFFESNNFSGALLYLYIVNLLSFIYFFSIRNFFDFYLPINIVIGMFVLVSVVAHNIGRKLIKSETFIKFYEKVLEAIANELHINIVYDNHVIFPHENKVNKKQSDDESQSVSSMENDSISVLNDKDLKKVSIEGFDGFEVRYNKQDVGLRKMSFLNK